MSYFVMVSSYLTSVYSSLQLAVKGSSSGDPKNMEEHGNGPMAGTLKSSTGCPTSPITLLSRSVVFSIHNDKGIIYGTTLSAIIRNITTVTTPEIYYS